MNSTKSGARLPDRYATHLPVLRALAKCVSMRRVLEIGAGEYSTPFFLSLPDLERLVSVEKDAGWRRRVTTDDPRHAVIRATPSMWDFDFVFVDDGQTEEERLRSIRFVLNQAPPPELVVAVHDAEVHAYAQAIRELAPGVTTFVCTETPHTAVVWPKGQAKGRELLRGMEEA